MEQIYVESNKTYCHGFILKEQDIRRIIDLINEQFKKLSTQEVVFDYVMKFQNGAVANTTDIETVLKQDNDGSTRIVRLEIKGEQTNDGKSSQIKIDFKNIDSDGESGESPIRHLIKGQSRDWVFVTSSLVEERIAKIKRRQMNPNSSKGVGKLMYSLLSPLLMLAIMISVLFSTPKSVTDTKEKFVKTINEIENKWKSHQITDPIDVIIQLEKARNSPENEIDVKSIMLSMLLSTPFIITIGSIILFVVLFFVFLKYYPTYNFYWGNYMDIFDKKENARKWIIGLLFGTLFLGIAINLLSNFIWQKI